MDTRKVVAAYVLASFLCITIFLADHIQTYRGFYPVMVALANSSAFRLLLSNTVVASTVLAWYVMQLIFFGKLNASEESALITSFTVYLAECIIVPLYFNLDVMSARMVFFAFTLVWRLMHKLAVERVTTLSTVQMTMLPVARMVAYLNLVLVGDVGVLLWLFQSRPELTDEKSSLHYSLLLIYMLLVTSSLRTAVRFASLFVLRGQHTLLPFVADAVTSIAESALFVGVYAYIFMKSTLPLLLLRGFISHALRIYDKASGLAEFLVLARRVRHDMPDATADDLARDSRCTICYEDMVAGGGTKRLPCGHCYHTDCLEHWLEGHSTCPYCRADIMRMPSNTATATAAAAAGEAAPPVADAQGDGEAAAAAGPPAAAQPAAPPLQPLRADDAAADPFAIRRRVLAAEARHHLHLPPPEHAEVSEADLMAAYERYLRRVEPAAAAGETRGATPSASGSGPAAVDEKARGHDASAEARAAKATAPATAAAPQADSRTSSPLRPSSPYAEPAASSVSATTPHRSPKTVEQLKLRAYKKYHKRLHEAEKELVAALKEAERNGAAA